MEMMKTVRIFLASPKELHDDRKEFADLIECLQNHYESRNYRFLLKKWEYHNPAYNNTPKQSEYNEIIKQCDLFIVIFHTYIGKNTLKEFEVALGECQKRKFPLFIYFKDLQGQETPKDIKEFQDRLTTELGHYWGTYDHIDTLKLDFVLWIDSQLFDGISKLKTEGGDITLGDVKVAEISQLPFAANNKDYQQLETNLNNLDLEIVTFQEIVQQQPNNEKISIILSKKVIEREQVLKELERQQEVLLSTARRIAYLRRQQVSKKLQSAINAFEKGQLDVANQLLEKLEHEGERLIEELETKFEQMYEHIDALWLQAQTVMADTEKNIDERISRVLDIYAKADNWASRCNYDKKKYAQLLYNYASFLEEFAKYELAEQILLRHIALSEEIYGIISSSTATSYNDIGVVYYDKKDYSKAKEYYFKSLELHKKVFGEKHPETAIVYNNISMLYKDQGDYDKALFYIGQDLEISEEVLGTDNPNIAKSYNNIGSIYKDQGDFSKAQEYYNRALDIYDKAQKKDYISIAKSYNNLGEVYYIQQNYEDALDYHLKALSIRENKLGSNHPDTVKTYKNIGKAYDSMGDQEMAMTFFNKVQTTLLSFSSQVTEPAETIPPITK